MNRVRNVSMLFLTLMALVLSAVGVTPAQAAKPDWSTLGVTPLDDAVTCITVNGTDVYVGGYFTDAGEDSNADYIAKWNGSAWSALGTTPLNGKVSSITVSGTDVYVGGNFTNAGGDLNADYIAKWNGNAWSALGTTPLNERVSVITVDGTDVYTGGYFTNVGGDPNADYIAKWDGSTWSALGTIPLSPSPIGIIVVTSIVVSGTDVYVGGDFTNAGGDPNADFIAKWDGSTWSALGTTPLNSAVSSIALSGTDVYAGGLFHNAGGDPNADHIAKWNGSAWSALGTTPLDDSVNTIAVNGMDVYVGGFFTNVGWDPNADYIAKWNGSAWSALGTTPLTMAISSIAISGYDLYVSKFTPDTDGYYISKLDINMPKLTSIVREAGALNPTSETSVNFTVTFDRPVTGVDADDFKLTTALTGTSITNVSGADNVYTVTVNTGIGSGTIRLDVRDTATIQDLKGYDFTGPYTGGETYTVVKEGAPTVQSITVAGPNPIDGACVDFTVTFDKPVTGVDKNDFSLTQTGGIVGPSIVTVTEVSQSVYTVTVNSGIGNGTIRLDLPATATIEDLSAHAFVGPYTGGETYTIKGPAPTVPVLKLPTNKSLLTTSTPTLDWGDSSQVMALATGWHYEIQVTAPYDAYNETFNTAASADPAVGLGASTFTIPAEKSLPANTTFTWRVRAFDAAYRYSAWSKEFTFNTGKSVTPPTVGAPKVPVLKLPKNKSLVAKYTLVRLDWNDSALPTTATPGSLYYEVRVTSPYRNYNATFTTITSEYTIPAENTLPAGSTFTWQVRSACNDGATTKYSAWSKEFTFRTKLATPTLLSPIDDALTPLDNIRPAFMWEPVPGAAGYTLQVLKDGKVVATGTVKAPAYSFTPTKDLLPNATYTWKVKANGKNPGDYSAPFTFVTGASAPAMPTPTAPKNNTLVESAAEQTLVWSLVDNATPALSYQVEYATNAAFTESTIVPAAEKQLLLSGGTLLPGRTYYWRVRSLTVAGNHSAWSKALAIKVKFVAPTLTSPANGDTNVPVRPTFTWSSTNGLWTFYTLQIAPDNTFGKGTRTIKVNAPTTKYTIPASLPALSTGVQYCWRVKINGLYSPVQSATVNCFTTAVP